MTFSNIRIDLNAIQPEDAVFGPIREGLSDTEISYIPYQISKYGIGIIAKSGLDVLHDLTLLSPQGEIKMRVLSVETNGMPENGARYSLMAVGLNIDLEQVYGQDSNIKDMVGRSLLHFARFQTTPPVILNARTFGSTNPYRFKTINASKNGVFVMSVNRAQVPFRVSTLVEFAIEPNDAWLKQGIVGVGRIAHQSMHEGKGGLRLQHYGMELKEFRGDGEQAWKHALEVLERQTIDRQLKQAEKASA